MPSQQVATTFSEILQAVQKRIIDSGIIPEDACFLMTDINQVIFCPENDQLIALIPTSTKPDEHIRIGAGRASMVMHAEFDAYVVARLALDQPLRKDSWLSDTNYGVMTLSENLVNCLELWNPLDGSNNSLIIIPFELQSVQNWEKKQPLEKNDIYIGWGGVRCKYKVQYYQMLNPPQQFNPAG